MLQLPQSQVSRGFSKTEIAEISRGTKRSVKKAVKPDPIIDLIKQADAALDEYIGAIIEKFEAEDRLGKDDRGYPHVDVPEELVNIYGYWTPAFSFTSETHIEKQFENAISCWRKRLRDERRGVRRLRKEKKSGWQQFVREAEQRVSSLDRKIDWVPKFARPLKASFKKEAARLRKVQTAAGLVKARERSKRATAALASTTKEVGSRRPQSVEGALAVVGYVEHRLWCDRPQYFLDDIGYFPAKLGPLLRSALAILRKANPGVGDRPH